MVGDKDIPSTLRPELEISFIPGRYGVGLNTGLYSHEPSFDADQYREGLEAFTAVTGSGDNWKSFFIGLGPRLEFGARLPVQFKTGVDLSFTRHAPPQSEVVFNDETGAFHDVGLTLSAFDAGDDYTRWSTAIKPEFQIQFSPGGSQRFGFHITTGVQHQLSDNSFSYSQRDLSNVKRVENVREMFFQFERAPVVERTEQPPKTNFFVNAGVKIKFGGRKPPQRSQPVFTDKMNPPPQDEDPPEEGDGEEEEQDEPDQLFVGLNGEFEVENRLSH